MWTEFEGCPWGVVEVASLARARNWAAAISQTGKTGSFDLGNWESLDLDCYRIR